MCEGHLLRDLLNAGQMCWAGSRLIVHQDVAEDLVDRIGPAYVTVGRRRDVRGRSNGNLVPQGSPGGGSSRLERGLAHGGRLHLGGTALGGDLEQGAFMAPTIVTDIGPSNPLFREELFGPVLAVTTFSEDAEALALANDSNSA